MVYPHTVPPCSSAAPNTGKTSFIKALAHKTGRSVVNIQLSAIKTNSELMALMYGGNVHLPDENRDEGIAPQKVVFVLEDIDCCGSIVKARAPAAALAPTSPSSTSSATWSVSTDSDSIGSSSTKSTKQKQKQKHKKTKHGIKEDEEDKLNLSGLLNCIDGVVDAPQRLLVMTSNHPELLDPALLRPGRVDCNVLLDYVKAPAALEMLQHFYSCDIQSGIRQVVGDALRAGTARVTPAMLQQVCMQAETVEAAVHQLSDLVHS